MSCLSPVSTSLTNIINAINTQVCTIQTNITSLQTSVGSSSAYPQDGRGLKDVLVTDETTQDHVNKTKDNSDKGDVASTSGLNVTIGAVDNALVRGAVSQRSQTVVALPATKDNYVYLNRTASTVSRF